MAIAIAFATFVPHALSGTTANDVTTPHNGDFLPLGTKVVSDCHSDTDQPNGPPASNPGHFFLDRASVALHAGIASYEDQSSTTYTEQTPIVSGATQNSTTCAVNFNTIVPARSFILVQWTGTLTLLTVRLHKEWDQISNVGVRNTTSRDWGDAVTFDVYDPKSPCTFRVAKIAKPTNGTGPRRARRGGEGGGDPVELAAGALVTDGDSLESGKGEVMLAGAKTTVTLPAGFATHVKLSPGANFRCESAYEGLQLTNGQSVVGAPSGKRGLRFDTMTDESTTEPSTRTRNARYKVSRKAGTRTTISTPLRGSIVVRTSLLHREQEWETVVARPGQRVVAIAGKRPKVLGKR